MPGSVRIGSLAGIDIYIHVSWLIAIVLLTVSTAAGWFPVTYPGYSAVTYIFLGLISALLLFISVLLHELAHSVVARMRGLPVKNIILFIFGGVSNIEEEPRSPGVEFQMAIVGPVVSLLIGVLAYLLLLPLGGRPSPLAAILVYLAIANILLGLFNLIPGYPLDGGRVLRAIVWKVTGSASKAIQVAAISGQVIGYLMILLAIWMFFGFNTLDGIWLAFIGWFIVSGAQSVRARATIDAAFSGVTVAQIMSSNVMSVPANISLQKLVDQYFLPQGLRSALVMRGEYLAGLITLADISRIPREEWERTLVGAVMVPVEKLHVIAPQQNVSEVLPLMGSLDVNQLPVMQNGQLVGVLTRDAVVRALEIRRSLHLDKAA